jgi:two-component system LytT family sensor kinase
MATRRDERSCERDKRLPEGARTGVDVVLGVVIGLGLAASAWAASRLVAGPRRVLSPEGVAMQAALHAATATLPHLRTGLSRESAEEAIGHLRALLQAPAVALADRDAILAFDGVGHEHHRGGDPLGDLLVPGRDQRVHVDTHLQCSEPLCPLRAAIVAPLVVGGSRVGSLIALYTSGGRLRVEDTRVAQDAASLVAAQLELAVLEAQGERLASAELRALRAQISPHFIYNALAAVASYIHSRPEEARELLTDFAEFTRYAFRRERPHVHLADELTYVEKYLRLERARFGDRLQVRLEVAPEILQAVVPVLSLQPLVENAVRHGVEPRSGTAQVTIVGRDLGADVELRVSDDGPGLDGAAARSALDGSGGGIGLPNVHSRLQATFGPGYGLEIESEPGDGTTVVMTLPKFRPGVRAS